MIRPRQFFLALAALAAIQTSAQDLLPPNPVAKRFTNDFGLPLPPVQPSPVAHFRELLAMTPAERTVALSNRPPEARARILNKVREYLALSPDERELRLRATELRFYLSPLFHAAPDERDTRLTQVPPELRSIVKSRLAQWDLLPPPLQKEFLAADRPLHYFAHVQTTNATPPAPEQQPISEQFDRFFEFTPQEKIQTLGTLSETERQQMETTLKNFEQLPLPQRRLCLKNFAKFAEMSPADRSEFLKNADRWSKMTPRERQSWRDLVANVPQWPPLPPPIIPANLLPPTQSIHKMRPGMATN